MPTPLMEAGPGPRPHRSRNHTRHDVLRMVSLFTLHSAIAIATATIKTETRIHLQCTVYSLRLPFCSVLVWLPSPPTINLPYPHPTLPSLCAPLPVRSKSHRIIKDKSKLTQSACLPLHDAPALGTAGHGSTPLTC